MKSLKEKFGKFALSAEQVKKVKGGTWTCYNGDGSVIGVRTRIESALRICDASPNCAGCF